MTPPDSPAPIAGSPLQNSESTVTELTRALVSIPSVNPDLEEGGDAEGPLARWIEVWLNAWDFDVSVTEPVAGRFNLVARLATTEPGPRIVLNGHMDTVGVSGMEVDPFAAEVRDDRIFGRGSADMKGGLAAAMVAARELARAGGPKRGELILAFTADEEYASVGLKALLDGGFTADEAIVLEPTGLEIQPANKGFTWLELEVKGRAAHGSRPELGRDAIRDAGRILAALDRYELRLADQGPHPLLGRGSIHAGTIRGGTAPPVYPDRCDLILEARILPDESPQLAFQRFEGILAEIGRDRPLEVELRQGLSRPGAEIPSDHPLVRGLETALSAEGITPRLSGMTAWVESAWFNEAGIPALCFGPGSLDLAHTAVESVPIAELESAVRALTRYLQTAFAREDR